MLQTLLVKLIEFYQRHISVLSGRSCVFYPTCSEYGKQALLKYGAMKGLWLTLKRFLRCHPFHSGGLDPLK